MASVYSENDISLIDRLEQIYKEYGYYKESLATYKMEGAAGMDKIFEIMQSLRDFSNDEIGGIKVKSVTDYYSDNIGLPKANVMKFFLDDGSFVAFRPSGTEPKFKVYFSVCGDNDSDCIDKTERIKSAVSKLIQ